MTVNELADLLGRNICLIRYHNQNERWSAQFEHCETKESEHGPVLSGTYGSGSTPDKALADYAQRISNQILVFNAYGGNNRQEFRCPQLTWRKR